MTHFYVK